MATGDVTHSPVLGPGAYGLTYEAAAAVTSFAFTGLTGDSDGGYEIEWVINATTTAIITLQPNALATNQTTYKLEVAGATVAGSTRTDLYLGTVAAGWNYGRCRLTSRTGRNRFLTSTNHWLGNASTHNTGEWRETSTAITSLTIVSSVASSIDAGSRATLLKLGSPLL